MNKTKYSKMSDCERDGKTRGERVRSGNVKFSEIWLNKVLNYFEESNEVSSVAIVCRKFRRIADSHDSWRVRVLRDGIRVEAARVDEKRKSHDCERRRGGDEV